MDSPLVHPEPERTKPPPVTHAFLLQSFCILFTFPVGHSFLFCPPPTLSFISPCLFKYRVSFSHSKFTEYYLAEYGGFDIYLEVVHLGRKQVAVSRSLVTVPRKSNCSSPSEPFPPASIVVTFGSV